MTDPHPENNKILHELFGKCWHVEDWIANHYTCTKCGVLLYDTPAGRWHPNYAADSRLVLEGMRELPRFLSWVSSKRYDFLPMMGAISVDLILDKTGRLRDVAIEFMKEEGK